MEVLTTFGSVMHEQLKERIVAGTISVKEIFFYLI
jgi:hypothetical protein